MALKQGLSDVKILPQNTQTDIPDESLDDEPGVSNEALQELTSKVDRLERSMSQRISEVERYSNKFVQINDRLDSLGD